MSAKDRYSRKVLFQALETEHKRILSVLEHSPNTLQTTVAISFGKLAGRVYTVRRLVDEAGRWTDTLADLFADEIGDIHEAVTRALASVSAAD